MGRPVRSALDRLGALVSSNRPVAGRQAKGAGRYESPYTCPAPIAIPIHSIKYEPEALNASLLLFRTMIPLESLWTVSICQFHGSRAI